MADLTKEQRDKLPDAEFAVPVKRKLPIHDKQHVTLAWSASDALTGDERLLAKRAILRKAHSLGVETKTWHLQNVSFEARSIDFGEVAEHCNRFPFSGVLTFLDEVSDKPVGGAGGKRVVITRAAGEAAIDSLLGMAVDFTASFDGHNHRSKIGVITGADIDGNEVKVSGYFWAADFPEEVALIKRDAGKLGFSYECRSVVQNTSADPLVVSALEFTGAAVLYKDKAAYMKTSLAARADQSGETKMEKDLQDALTAMATSIAAIPGAVSAAVTTALKASSDEDKKTKVEAAKANAATLRASAASLRGQSLVSAAVALEAEASHIEAFTGKNEVPPPFVAGTVQTPPVNGNSTDLAAAIALAMKPTTDVISSMATAMTDLQHKVNNGVGAPQRKTLDAANTDLLKKAGLDISGDKKLTVAELDAACAKSGLPGFQSMALKMSLKDAGILSV